jgi:hypothetical protein
MNDLGATGEFDFVGDDFAIDDRRTCNTDGAFVGHQYPRHARLTIQSHVVLRALDVEQDIVPSQTIFDCDVREKFLLTLITKLSLALPFNVRIDLLVKTRSVRFNTVKAPEEVIVMLDVMLVSPI